MPQSWVLGQSVVPLFGHPPSQSFPQLFCECFLLLHPGLSSQRREGRQIYRLTVSAQNNCGCQEEAE